MLGFFDDQPTFLIGVWFLYILALLLNIVSLVTSKIIRVLLNQETFFVTLIIAILSITGCSLTIMAFFQSGDSRSFVSLLALAMPVTYNIVLPGVLTRGISRLKPDYQKPCSCRFFYTVSWVVLLVYYVMIVSSFPILMITRNIRVARSVNQQSSSKNYMVSMPVLHFTGAICQISTLILSLGELRNFSGKLFPCSSKNSHENNSQSQGYLKLPAAKYLIYWAYSSLFLISLSALARCFELYFSDYIVWFIVYMRVLSDCCLFMTQPIALIILQRVNLTNSGGIESAQNDNGRNLNPQNYAAQNQSAAMATAYLDHNNRMLPPTTPHYPNQNYQLNYLQAAQPSGQLPPVPSYEYATSSAYPYYYTPATIANVVPTPSQVTNQFYPNSQVQYKVD
ncbi:uncharacterized protein LOC142338633 [Convolutriloba macropyga]|uniref:uncharacterized protein LOC142338633 n=1 Tax=Convolutriloba macropyga TaxID=536237 RepID=UPI003F523706